MMVVAATASAGIALIEKSFKDRYSESRQIELPERIKLLTDNLNDSAQTIAEIEMEIAQRQVLVEKLQRDAELAQRLAEIKGEQAEAVAQALKAELEKQNRYSVWISFGINLICIFIGIALTEFYHRKVLPWWSTKAPPPPRHQ